MVCRWKSGDNLQESILSFHFMDAGNWTLAIRLGNKSFNSLSNLAILPVLQEKFYVITDKRRMPAWPRLNNQDMPQRGEYLQISHFFLALHLSLTPMLETPDEPHADEWNMGEHQQWEEGPFHLSCLPLLLGPEFSFILCILLYLNKSTFPGCMDPWVLFPV